MHRDSSLEQLVNGNNTETKLFIPKSLEHDFESIYNGLGKLNEQLKPLEKQLTKKGKKKVVPKKGRSASGKSK
jgi:hypothetical protein